MTFCQEVGYCADSQKSLRCVSEHCAMATEIRYRFGLIGKTLGHSFSREYHNARFARELPSAYYDLYELQSAAEVCELLRREPLIRGLNVTIPYKTSVIPYLDSLDPLAARAGAVNTIARANGELIGYNTDVDGFVHSLRPHLPPTDIKALVFGTGGSSRAIRVGLEQLGIESTVVSRKENEGSLTYTELGKNVIADHRLLINCTPVGMYPNTTQSLPIPYSAITSDHIAFDLVYNPEKTVFLERSESNGATIVNGLEMLHLQADRAWEIWRQHLDIRI